MGALTRIGWLAPSTNSPSSTANQSASFRRFSSLHHRQILLFKTLTVSVIEGPCPVSARAEEDVLEAFFRDRKLNGDLITKASDILFQREARKSDTLHDGTSQQVPETSSNESEGGFLKLSITREWVSGENTAPLNRKSYKKELQDDSERRKRLNFLNYAACAKMYLLICGEVVYKILSVFQLKRELMLLTVAIGAACSGYCLITLSVQAAISYAAGVVFSCLYLQLLCRHVDDISKDSVPRTFAQKKSKKVGIRSEDLKDFVERSVKGSGIALSSPRLVIPAAIYGLWFVSHRYVANDVFDFQIVPAMLGMFAYKGAALVQVYRDNENLQFVFPENEQSSSE